MFSKGDQLIWRSIPDVVSMRCITSCFSERRNTSLIYTQLRHFALLFAIHGQNILCRVVKLGRGGYWTLILCYMDFLSFETVQCKDIISILLLMKFEIALIIWGFVNWDYELTPPIMPTLSLMSFTWWGLKEIEIFISLSQRKIVNYAN